MWMSGCGRIGFDQLRGSTLNNDASAMGDGSVLISGQYRAKLCNSWGVFAAPTVVNELNMSDGNQGAGSISADGLTFFISSASALWGTNGYDILFATRATLSDPWMNVALLSAVNTLSSDQDFAIASSGLEAYFSEFQQGGTELFRVTRATQNDTWSMPVVAPAPLNVMGRSAASPVLTYDGKELYLASDRSNGTDEDVWVFRRADAQSAWDNGTSLALVNNSGPQAPGSVSSDGLELFVSSNNGLDLDIWRATRAEPTASWGNYQMLTKSAGQVNQQGSEEFRPVISPDGTTLYFSSSRVGGGRIFIYQATRACLN